MSKQQPPNSSPEQRTKMQRRGKIFGWVFGILIVLGLLFLLTFNWITDYIWMDNLDFGSVFTTILGSRLILVAIGFVLFFATSFITLAWIRSSYTKHFHESQLPPFLSEKKYSRLIIAGVSLLVGVFGSTVVQGLGWEPLLKFLQHEQFGVADPHFNMDISFYMFVLPFIEFIIYLILTMGREQ